MSTQTTDVLIVGAGPAGLCTAIQLAQNGIDFLLIDALPDAQNTSRAAVIHAATLDSLEGIGVADQLVAQGIKAHRFRIRDRDRILFHSDFTKLTSVRPYALMIPQDETEAILLNRLHALGGKVIRPARFERFVQTGDGIRATVQTPDGVAQIAARWLVGTDGQDSAVRQAAGVDFPGESYGSFLLADVRMDWPIPLDEVSLFFSHQGTLVVAPMSDARYRIVAQYPDAPASPQIADVQAVIDARGPHRQAAIHEVLWGSRFRVHHKLADRFRDGPVILTGDAAHVHSPAGGQGMNLGIRDAIILGQALTQVVRGAPDTALDDYAAQRRLAAQKVLAMTDRLTHVATMTNMPGRIIRNNMIALAGLIPGVRSAVARRLAGYT